MTHEDARQNAITQESNDIIMPKASHHSSAISAISAISALARSALALPAATLLALAPPAFALNFNDTGGWRAPLSLDTTSVHRGDPTKVAWSIVPDGPRIGYPGDTYNTLNASLKARCGANYADMFTFTFNRIGAVSGLALVASPDDGALPAETTPAIAGVRGEIRLVGSDLVAEQNWWGGGWANGPGQGVAAVVHLNMGLNTGPNPPSYSDWLDMAMHETGHAIGFGHQQIYENSTTTIEYGSATNHYGSITGFRNGNGPQFDDVYAMHRMYGDRWERNGGNDTLASAENLGDLTDGTRALGTDIVGLSIAPDKIDFRSIDGTSDTDCFKFTVTKRCDLRVSVAPVGPTYDFAPEGGTRRTFESSRQSALWMVLYNASGVPVQTVNAAGVGTTRSLVRTLEAGTYTVGIAGTEDLNQFYRLDLAAVSNNSPLTISSLADPTIVVNTNTGPLAFTVADLAVPAASLTVRATSSNTTLLPNANIVLGGSGANRTVTATPVPGPTGAATIVLTVSDGSLTASSSFSLSVIPPPPFTYTVASGAATLIGYTGTGGSVNLPGTINGLPVTAIADHAFASCSSITSVTIPAGITSIGMYPFADCPLLTAIMVAGANVNYSSVDGVLFDKAQTVLVQYPGAKTGSYTLPASVTSIADHAFHQCANLTGVTISASVTTIGNAAFAQCPSLASAFFMGNAPAMGSDVFIAAASGFSVQYYDNRSGFTTPLWNGYPSTNLGNAVALIVVEQPSGIVLTNGSGTIAFGASLTGEAVPLAFTIRNTGSVALSGIAVTTNGTNAADYALTTAPPSSLAAGASSAFVVTFTPTAVGTRTAALHVASNDVTNNPFTLLLAAAVTLPTTRYEAEAVGNTRVNCGVIGDGAASGGARVAKSNYGIYGGITFNNINAATAGNYDLSVCYYDPWDGGRNSYVSVNGVPAPLVGPHVPLWCPGGTYLKVTRTVPLVAGNNTITIYAPPNEWGPHWDYIEISPQLPPQNVSGRITNGTNGIAGATVYFKTTPLASVSPYATATTDAGGYYTQSLPPAAWYACASAAGYALSSDTPFTVAVSPVTNLNMTLVVVPEWDVLFIATVDQFSTNTPDSPIPSWPLSHPAGYNLVTPANQSQGVPTIAAVNGINWLHFDRGLLIGAQDQNAYTFCDGYKLTGLPEDPSLANGVPVSGVSIVAVVQPILKANSNVNFLWGSSAEHDIVGLYFDGLVLGVNTETGEVVVKRKGALQSTRVFLADGRKTILSLVVQLDGSCNLYQDGAGVWSGTAFGSNPYALLTGSFHQIGVGTDAQDGPTSFNGNIGDVYVYKTAISDAKRSTLQSSLGTKFGIAIAGANDYATWALTNAPGQSPSEDYNHDGVQNGIAYFMGAAGLATNPGLDASHHITWPMSETFSGSYEVQSSSDLKTWVPVVPQPSPAGGNLTYSVAAGLGRQFVRLVVTPH